MAMAARHDALNELTGPGKCGVHWRNVSYPDIEDLRHALGDKK
jgi:hypothetical protein